MDLPFKELFLMMRGLIKGIYPNFVLRNGYQSPTPIFYYHQVDYEEFSEHLDYLKYNGYSTLTAEEYYQAISSNCPLSPRSVVLTFDDGLVDLHTIIFPLLKQYDYKASSFIIPKYIGEKGNIDWHQAHDMHQSGVIDFQSHSLRHAAIFKSDNLIDFFHPGLQSIHPWNQPLIQRNGSDCFWKYSDLGMPIFEFASRLSDAQRYFPDPRLEQVCMKVVKEEDNDRFFKTKHWRKKLIKVFRHYQAEHKTHGRYETEDEKKRSIAMELILSKQQIEKNLPGKIVRHFAFPWSQTGKIAERLLSYCGYESAYVGLPAKKTINSSVNGVRLINRVSGDFVLRLPGENRRSLIWIIRSKIKRRLFRKSIAMSSGN